MKKEVRCRIEYTLEPQDEKLIKMCLDYSSYRFKKHDNCGITGLVNIDLLEKLRKELS